MCTTCGCNLTSSHSHIHPATEPVDNTPTDTTVVTVLQNLLAANDQQAAHNREHFDAHAVLAINLMSAPGSGKTRLLEKTIERLREEYAIAVIEGDLETENDAQRIRAKGVPAIQITTGTACHLDAHLLHNALHQLDLSKIDVVFVENVGNLVCPASFDLGQHRNVVLLSVPEGDDKPAKYPVMFRVADVVLMTKADLLPYLQDFKPAQAEAAIRQLANPAPVWPISDRDPNSFTPWLDWLRAELQHHRSHCKK